MTNIFTKNVIKSEWQNYSLTGNSLQTYSIIPLITNFRTFQFIAQRFSTCSTIRPWPNLSCFSPLFHLNILANSTEKCYQILVALHWRRRFQFQLMLWMGALTWQINGLGRHAGIQATGSDDGNEKWNSDEWNEAINVCRVHCEFVCRQIGWH